MTVTGNRATESDLSAVDVDNYEISPMKKRKVDEEDDGYIESEKESESEEDEGSGDYKDIPEPNPEWDVDSYDGRECESDPEIRDCFSDDEGYMLWRAKRVKALQHKGFLPDPWNDVYPVPNLDGPGCRNMTNREYLASMASLSVKKLNKEKGTTVEFVSIVRANVSGAATWKSYITFMAREYPNGPLVEYQAKVMDFCGQRLPPFPILCRPALYPTI